MWIVQQGRYNRWETTFNHDDDEVMAENEFHRLRLNAPFLDYRLLECRVVQEHKAQDD